MLPYNIFSRGSARALKRTRAVPQFSSIFAARVSFSSAPEFDESAALPAPAATSWKGVPRFYASASAAEIAGEESSYCVMIDERAARTSGARPLVLPSHALALAIAGEFAAQRGVVQPSTMPLYNLACAAIDSYSLADAREGEDADALARASRLAAFDRFAGGAGGAAVLEAAAALEARAPAHTTLTTGRLGGALASDGGSGAAKLRDLLLDSLETDTVCFRVDAETSLDVTEKQLLRRQEKYYGPLQNWFAGTFGAKIGTASGFAELEHSDGAYVAVEDVVATASPWLQAALGSVCGVTKSTIISFALVHGFIDARGALDAARLEEEWQISQNG